MDDRVEVAVNRVFHDGRYPSHLRLCVVETAGATGRTAPAGRD
jgi:hypothetical protein